MASKNGAEPLPPHSEDAERALLGSVLIDPAAYYTAAATLSPEDFYLYRHRLIWEAYRRIVEKRSEIDLLTVSEALGDKLEEVGGAAFLIGLLNEVPTSTNAANYARLVRDYAQRRAWLNAAREIAQLAYNTGGDWAEVRGEVQKAVMAPMGSATDAGKDSGMEAVVRRYMELMERRRDNPDRALIPTGFYSIDKLMGGGLFRGEFTVIGARPGMGKTAIAIDIATHAAAKGFRVLIVSAEMTEDRLVERKVARLTGIETKDLRRPWLLEDHDSAKVYSALGQLAQQSIFIMDKASLNVMDIIAEARRVAMQYGLDLVVVDYVQLVSSLTRQNRHQEISEVANGLKRLANELGVHVIGLAQLSRSVEALQDKHPSLSHLKESGDIEQAADNVWFIYRDEYYNPDDTPHKGKAEINIAKQREGLAGPGIIAWLRWDGSLTRFQNLYHEPTRQELSL